MRLLPALLAPKVVSPQKTRIAVAHMEMTRDLTESQYFSLPLVSSKDRVVGMKAIFVHTNLKNSPVSILTATGQYKLSPKMSTIAAKAFYAARDRGGYDGDCDGRLGTILKKMRGTPDASSICSETPEVQGPEHESSKLEILAAKLAKEALGDLQTLTVNAVEAEFRRARGAVMQAALSRLGELD